MDVSAITSARVTRQQDKINFLQEEIVKRETKIKEILCNEHGIPNDENAVVVNSCLKAYIPVLTKTGRPRKDGKMELVEL